MRKPYINASKMFQFCDEFVPVISSQEHIPFKFIISCLTDIDVFLLQCAMTTGCVLNLHVNRGGAQIVPKLVEGGGNV